MRICSHCGLPIRGRGFLFACPCAMGIAAPLARAVAIGKAAKMGIAVPDAAALASAPRPTVLVIDKTGTLTKGSPRLEGVRADSGGEPDENTIIALAASLDSGANHPFAAALAKTAKDRGIAIGEATDVKDRAGFGRRAKIGAVTCLLGNERFMESESAAVPEWARAYAREQASGGHSVSYLAKIEGNSFNVMGVLSFADELRPEAPAVMRAMIKAGIRPILATGDHAGAAGPVAAQCGIGDVFASLGPEEKRDLVVRLKNKGNVVWALGDGVNDAPALAVAALGMAMGGGAKMASESAHLTLASGQLESLPFVLELSRHLAKTEKQNLAWAILYNAVGLPAAFFGLLKPLFSALAMSASSLSVVVNSLRLKSPSQ